MPRKCSDSSSGEQQQARRCVDPEGDPHHAEVAVERPPGDAAGRAEQADPHGDVHANEERQADGVQDQDDGKRPEVVAQPHAEAGALEPGEERIHGRILI